MEEDRSSVMASLIRGPRSGDRLESEVGEEASEETRTRDSLDSADSLSIDTSAPVPGPSSLPSPGPDLKFAAVFRKIAADIQDFSIIDEEPSSPPLPPLLQLPDTLAIPEMDSSAEGTPVREPSTVSLPVLEPEEKAVESAATAGGLEDSGLGASSELDLNPATESLAPPPPLAGLRQSPSAAELSARELESAQMQVRELLSQGRRWPSQKELPECLGKLWASQLTAALAHLHAEGLIVRDLDPKKLLLDESGDLILSYRSEWACVNKPRNAEAISRLYSAPGSLLSNYPCGFFNSSALFEKSAESMFWRTSVRRQTTGASALCSTNCSPESYAST